MKSLLTSAVCLIYLLSLYAVSTAQCLREPISRENIQNLEAIAHFSIDDVEGIGVVGWSKDGEVLYVVTQNKTGKDEMRAFHTSDFTLPPKTIVLEENLGRLWILNTGEIVLATDQEDLDLELHHQPILTVPESTDALALSGDFYIRATQKVIQVINYATNDGIVEFDTKYDPTCEYACYIGNVAISPDENRIAYGSYSYLIPSAVINIEEETVLYDTYVMSAYAIFSPNGDLIVSSGGEPGYFGTGGIYLADGYNGDKIAIVSTTLQSNIAFSPDSSLLVAGVMDSEYPKSDLTVWDVEQLVQNGTGDDDTAIFQTGLPHTSEGVYIGTLAFNPAGTLLVTSTFSYDITNMRPEVAQHPPYINVWGIADAPNCND